VFVLQGGRGSSLPLPPDPIKINSFGINLQIPIFSNLLTNNNPYNKRGEVCLKGPWMPAMKSILMVSDDQSLRLTLSLILRRAGYTDVSAIDPGEVCQSMEQNIYDLVILDVKTLDAARFAIIREIIQFVPATRLLVITGGPTPETNGENKGIGMSSFLLKPVNPGLILARVRDMLANH
jgi:CheY-like chemotaxis protein